MTVAERTREAVREHPFLHDALRAGVVNYTAAARYLDVGEEATVAAALRRYAGEIEAEQPGGGARVRMHRGLRRVEADGELPASGLLAVGGTGFVPGDGSLTAILATGTVTAGHLRRILGRCAIGDVDVVAAGMADATLVLVTGGASGPTALRIVESTVSES